MPQAFVDLMTGTYLTEDEVVHRLSKLSISGGLEDAHARMTRPIARPISDAVYIGSIHVRCEGSWLVARKELVSSQNAFEKLEPNRDREKTPGCSCMEPNVRLQPLSSSRASQTHFECAACPLAGLQPAGFFATGFNRWWTARLGWFNFPSSFSRLQPVLLPEPARLNACYLPEDREPSPAEAG
ncbi:MAG: hypothetical protein L6R00_21125 [Phycisphaerae bacterium]|nr:hypothetical protein [Phycisphaerae bacterium]